MASRLPCRSCERGALALPGDCLALFGPSSFCGQLFAFSLDGVFARLGRRLEPPYAKRRSARLDVADRRHTDARTTRQNLVPARTLPSIAPRVCGLWMFAAKDSRKRI